MKQYSIHGIIPVLPVMATLPWVIILFGASGNDSCGTVDMSRNCGGVVLRYASCVKLDVDRDWDEIFGE